jgi:segregation and condensation protein A
MTEPSPPETPVEGTSGREVQPAPAAGAVTSAYRIELPVFEGPLDLLLHLIEEHELDIFDIPIAFVATKFVETITLMQELNIDVASEYLVMAATLAHIKSKMLLPVVPDDQEDEAEPELDPRAELVRRLLEYQKYKRVADQLGEHAVLGRDVFLRGVPAPEAEGPAPIAGLSLFKLLDAFQTVLARVKATFDHQIDAEHFSITDRINQLSELLQTRRRIPFIELFDGQTTRSDLITTFLALLEMTRLRLTLLFQDDPLGPIEIELAVSDEPAVAPPDVGEGGAPA